MAQVLARCPNDNCRKEYPLSSELLGQSIHCTECGEDFVPADTLNLDERNTDESDPEVDEQSATTATKKKRRLGRFELGERLGVGAYGAVYRAFDPKLDREVALKVARPGTLEKERTKERFIREAKAAAQLRHPNIVPVYDAGTAGDHYYIASAYVEGRSLDSIQNGDISLQQSAEIIAKLADALHYAHRKGIVHRDVKPGNIILDTTDEPHLMDFGLASREDSEQRLTTEGAVLGTPAYMSPEQAEGRSAEAGPASDQYSLGVALYELMCGETPFAGPIEVLVYNTLHKQPPRPRKGRPYIPIDLETICMKALSKRPELRYADCHELAADLYRWLNDEPIRARRAGYANRFVRWCRREPSLAAAVAVSTCLLLMVTGYSMHSARILASAAAREQALLAQAQEEAGRARIEAQRAHRAFEEMNAARKEAEKEKLRAEQQSERAERALATAEKERRRAEDEAKKARLALDQLNNETARAEAATAEVQVARRAVEAAQSASKIALDVKRQARLSAYFLDMQIAGQAHAKNDLERLGEIIRKYPPAGPDASIQSFEWNFLAQEVTPWSREIFTEPLSFDVTSSGKLVHFQTRRLTRTDLSNGRRTTVPKIEFTRLDGRSMVAASPDGRWAATVADGNTVRVWELSTGRDRWLGSFSNRHIVAFDPNGKYLAAGSASTDISIILAESGDQVRKISTAGAGILCMAYSAGRMLAAGLDNGTVRIWSSTGQLYQIIRDRKHLPRSLVFSGDGREIYIGDRKGISVADIDDGTVLRTVRPPAGIGRTLQDIALSPNNSLIAMSVSDSKLRKRFGRVLIMRNPHNVLVEEKNLGVGSIGKVLFSQDGRSLIVGHDRYVYVWPIGPTVEVNGATQVSLAANLDFVATAAKDRVISIWKVNHPSEPLQIVLERSFTKIKLSPNGSKVAIAFNQGILIYNVNSPPETRKFIRIKAPIVEMEFISKDRIVVACADRSVTVWDIENAFTVSTYRHPVFQVLRLASAANGNVIASADFKKVAIRDARRPFDEPLVLNTSHRPDVLSFQSNGNEFVVRNRDNHLEVRDTVEGKLKRVFKDHPSQVIDAVFSPDGRLLVAAGTQWLRFWDLETGQERTTIRRFPDGLRPGIRFSSDGKALAAIGNMRLHILRADKAR